MKFLMILCLCAGVISVTPNAHAVKLGTRIKAAFGNKEAKVEVKQHRAEKHAEKAVKACEKGKHRKCERHKRLAASNQYAADTGDFKGARKMKKRDRKLRRAKKACRKGKRMKCDRLSRKAEFKNCLFKGGTRKDCRRAKRQARKDQRGFRKGFTDVNTTRGIMSGLNHQQNVDRGVKIDVGNDLDFTAQDTTGVLTDIITAVQAILVSTSSVSNLAGAGNQVAAGSDNTDALLIFYESSASNSDAVIIRYQEDATADTDFDTDELSVFAIFENIGSGNFDTANII